MTFAIYKTPGYVTVLIIVYLDYLYLLNKIIEFNIS